jgi:hypothetical protein
LGRFRNLGKAILDFWEGNLDFWEGLEILGRLFRFLGRK